MSSPEGPSFPSGLLSRGTSPSSNEGFFPFMLERRDSFLGGGPRPEEPEDLALQLQQKEKDLLLAAELGKMLLERNEELQRRLEMLSAQHSEHEERLQQENHELRRGLAARGAEWQARTVELEGDVEALRAQLGEQRSEQQDSGRERARALSELSEQNLQLSQQLAQLELARSEAGEALSALRRLQRRVSELEEESRLQDANISGASLQSELAHSLDSKDQDQNADRGGDALATLPPETQEASSHQPSPQEERLEPPRKRASLSPAEILEEKEAEVVRLQDEIALQQEELQSLREELQRQKELQAQKDPEKILSGALSDRDEAVNKSLELALELSRVSLERDSLSRELLRTIRQKVALTQELEAWQDDMQVVIGQQLRSQRQKELSAAGSAPSRNPPRLSLRLGPGPAGGFFSNLFRRT
ncbi:BICD family-like cargo adapter 2 isoform X3 [Lagenorhynchus albirostris]|uniref:BICD family-like cargo adapter 2 isoform X3 n=1 Tax=Lagenorhynchus albirostris TaxID=27610 RepID=UPI0028E52EB1|nr:BICD family-like cargo adapter 2 isoform X3 [Lagenorhynchus albirostris]